MSGPLKVREAYRDLFVARIEELYEQIDFFNQLLDRMDNAEEKEIVAACEQAKVPSRDRDPREEPAKLRGDAWWH